MRKKKRIYIGNEYSGGNENSTKYGETYVVDGYYIDETSCDIENKKQYEVKQSCYEFDISEYVKDDNFYDVLDKNTLTVSECIDIDKKYKSADFCLFRVYGGYLRGDDFFSSSYGFGKYHESCLGNVTSIVKLKTNVNTYGKNEIGIWQLCD